MVRIDRQDDGEVRAEKGANLGRRYGRIRQEIQRLQALGRAVEAAPDGQIPLTDPDSRAMATSARRSGLVGYNVQAAVDAETHLIITHDVTNEWHDRNQLAPMAKAAKAALGRNEMDVIADKGYFSGHEILACHKAGITATVPRPDTSGSRSKGTFVKADFACDAAADVYRCPAGRVLTYRYTTEENGLRLRRYWTGECRNCWSKSICTTAKERRITRWEHEHLVDEMRDRISCDHDLMVRRRCTVEHPFGTIQAWMGGTYFLTRRLKNARTEMALNVLAYNIKRVINMIGVGQLLKAMTA